MSFETVLLFFLAAVLIIGAAAITYLVIAEIIGIAREFADEMSADGTSASAGSHLQRSPRDTGPLRDSGQLRKVSAFQDKQTVNRLIKFFEEESPEDRNSESRQ